MKKYKIRWVLALFFFLIVGIGMYKVFCLCPSTADQLVLSDFPLSTATTKFLTDMKNEDVVWHGTIIGLSPELTGATLSLEQTSEDITPYLVEALLDKKKFVAAHVLLAFRLPAQTLCKGGRDLVRQWCGLKVQIDTVAGTTFYGNSLRKLQCDWRQILSQ